jgi:hypothetical protein
MLGDNCSEQSSLWAFRHQLGAFFDLAKDHLPRGQEVEFKKNSAMEIRFGPRRSRRT